jgi:hypothetical protein
LPLAGGKQKTDQQKRREESKRPEARS